MNENPILAHERLRRVPSRFSWVDHRLVRMNYLQRAPGHAWGLYLTLVTVGDKNGVSYYSDRTLARLLGVDHESLVKLRGHLLAADVIAYREPYYQVLELEGSLATTERRAS